MGLVKNRKTSVSDSSSYLDMSGEIFFIFSVFLNNKFFISFQFIFKNLVFHLFNFIKPCTYLTFNTIRVLKRNVLTFCLHKVLKLEQGKFTSFLKEIFCIYFGHNRNSKESYIHELKSFSSLEHDPKSGKSASALLKLCLHLC